MSRLIMRVDGFDGQVELMADRVVIHRRGIVNAFKYGIHAKREIPLSAISEIAFRDATFLVFGEIDFVRSGRSMDEKMRRGSSVVRFARSKQKQFEELKEKAFELLEAMNTKRHA